MSRALGRYELLRPLARGGMAEVFLARRRAAGVEKWLVVKRIRAERATDVQFLDLFVREARLSMSLAHQNIVPVFDFGRIDDQVFLAMERVEGRDLASCLSRANTPLSPLLAAFIAAECCQALDYAHRRKSPEGMALGIVHRDVTPRNVLLSWSGEVKLTDFGIAALAGDANTALLGTPAYMAPEQARKETLDARTDVYAVGLILREMLTGTRARAGVDRDSLVGAARSGELLPWPAHELPPTLVAIVDKATASSPADRHTDARALLAELDEFLVGERAAKKADSPTRQLAAWLDRVWGTERDDESASSGEIVADHMVSFLDDGALVLGTGTQRSLVATAAEEPAANGALDDTLAASVANTGSDAKPPVPKKASGAFDETLTASSVSSSTNPTSSDASADTRSTADPASLVSMPAPASQAPAPDPTADHASRAPAADPANRSAAASDDVGAHTPSVTSKPAPAGDQASVTSKPAPAGDRASVTSTSIPAGDRASVTSTSIPAGDHAPMLDVLPRGAPRWTVLALVGLIAIGALVFFATRGGSSDPVVAQNDLDAHQDVDLGPLDGGLAQNTLDVADLDAATAQSELDAAHAGRDVANAVDPANPVAAVDAGIARERVDAAVEARRDASIALSRDASVAAARDASVAAARDASVAARDASTGGDALQKRRVTITSTPWSFFRVDDDPKEYEARTTVLLSPGRHVIHFNNPELKLTKKVTIDVPTDRDLQHVESLP